MNSDYRERDYKEHDIDTICYENDQTKGGKMSLNNRQKAISHTYAWHFSDGDGRLIAEGAIFTCDDDKLVLCEYGFHASHKLLDALYYAPGNTLSFVACEGRIIESYDKLVCSKRTHIYVADIEHILHEFACWCAEQALTLIDNPDPRSIAAVTAKRQWLAGEIDDKQLAAARTEAWDAAGDAAGDAAWDAARTEAWAAAGDAAGDAARAEAGTAARAETSTAAWNAARAEARNAAWNAAWDAQNIQLTNMVSMLPAFRLHRTSTKH